MSDFDYPSLLNTASDIVGQFGRTAQLKRSSGTRYCKVVEVGYSPQERDGSVIQYTDRRFLCDAKNLAPGPDAEEDYLLLDAEQLRIVTVTRVQPSDLNVLWDLQVRR
jgi:hypothetical protein